jgi:hypothetical protein
MVKERGGHLELEIVERRENRERKPVDGGGAGRRDRETGRQRDGGRGRRRSREGRDGAAGAGAL